MWFGRDPRIGELQEALERLQGQVKALRVEWEDTYDKLRRTLARIAKSRAMIEARESDEGTEAPAASSTLTGPTPVGGRFTERQKEIQQQILRRRAGG